MVRPPPETERGFQQAVVDLARRCGWQVYHTYDSRRSTSDGWPDLFLCHVGRRQALAVECKRQDGTLTPAQAVWLDTLQACGVECHVWRPSDFETIRRRLQQGPG
jgi:hypothetical protein